MQNNRIEEYKATQDMYKHFNILKWQVGSVLIGTIGVVTGFAFSSTRPSQWFPFLFFFSLILMVTWGVYGELCSVWNKEKHRQLHELEEDLSFCQHRYCRDVNLPWFLIRAQDATRLLVFWIPVLFLFLWLGYYGIIVIAVSIVMLLLYLRKKAVKEGKNISELVREILYLRKPQKEH